MKKFIIFSLFFFSAVGFSQPKTMGITSTETPKEMTGIGISEKLGTQLNLNLQVRNEKGDMVPLKSFFNGNKPVMLSLVYFSCPGLCNFHLNGVTEALKKMDWKVSDQFDVIALSFDPKETADVAAKKKMNYLKVYQREGSESGWHFLTAEPETIKALTESIGFQYKWDEQSQEWAHASAAIILSPDGKVMRYLHGILFEPQDIKLSLMDAMNGKMGTVTEKMVWFCYKYDPHQSKYTLAAARLMQMGGGVMILLLIVFLLPFWIRSKREQKV